MKNIYPIKKADSADVDLPAEELPPAEKDWPIEWKKIFFKSYPRFPRLSLAERVEALPNEILAVIGDRESCRDFSSEPVTLGELANLLYYSARIKSGSQKRVYPSGGGRYPLEIYPMVIRGAPDLAAGLYHWNVKENCLEEIFRGEVSEEEKEQLISQDWARNAPVILWLSAVFWRSEVKYGEKAERLILIEAGHLAHNLCLVSRVLGLKHCELAGFYDEAVNKFLGIEKNDEAVVHSLVLGH